MNVRLKPLDGKYYGTVVELLDGPLKGNEIKIWLNTRDWEANDGHEPSDRELVYNRISRADHERLKKQGWDDTPVDICGGHSENWASFRVAIELVDALRRMKCRTTGR